MSFLVSRAKVLSNKRPVALREVAMVDLFWIVIELVPVQVFCSRITLAAALMGTFELLVQSFSTSSAFSRGASCVASIFAVIVRIHAVSILIISIATPASSFLLAWRGGSWRLDG